MHGRPRQGAALLTLAASLGLAAAASPADAAAPRAVWQMNEPRGATVMHDSSGHGLNGRIGSEVQTHTVVRGRTGYGFPFRKNNVPPAHPEHLVTVPSNPLLDPGAGDYAVTVTLRFTNIANGSNVVQKGQSGGPGGFFKLEIDRGGVVCLFRGSAGSAGGGSGRINDGAFHTVRCARTGDTVTVTVDGRTTATRNAPTGTIANSGPLVIGGKSQCNQTTVQCDYFTGTIDRVQID